MLGQGELLRSGPPPARTIRTDANRLAATLTVESGGTMGGSQARARRNAAVPKGIM